MKKVLMTLMIASLLVLPLGSVALAEHAETVPSEVPVTLTPVGEFIPGDVPAQSNALDSIAPALHATVLAMLNQDAETFSAEDPLLAWESLYNMVSLYGQMDNRSEYLGDALLLPSETVSDYAAALIPDFYALGPTPEALADRLVYDEASDSYLVTCGENGLSELVLNIASSDSDTLCVNGCLVYLVDGSVLTQFYAELSVQDSMFGYTISALELI